MEAGIYFLIKDNKVVYVGKTIEWPFRLKSHIYYHMDFDNAKFLKYPKDDLDRWERAYIKKYNPIYNKMLKQKPVSNKKNFYIVNPRTQYGKSEIKKHRKMKFRKLTEKSFLDYGHFKHCTVAHVIAIGHSKMLISSYFKLSHITFFDNILDQIGISEEWRIKKPGTDIAKFNEFIEAHPEHQWSEEHKQAATYFKAKTTIAKINKLSSRKGFLKTLNQRHR